MWMPRSFTRLALMTVAVRREDLRHGVPQQIVADEPQVQRLVAYWATSTIITVPPAPVRKRRRQRDLGEARRPELLSSEVQEAFLH